MVTEGDAGPNFSHRFAEIDTVPADAPVLLARDDFFGLGSGKLEDIAPGRLDRGKAGTKRLRDTAVAEAFRNRGSLFDGLLGDG